MRNAIQRFGYALLILTMATLSVLSLRGPQQAQAQSFQASRESKFGWVYDSVAYAYYGASILSGNTATGAQTITVCPAIQTMADGRTFQPLSPSNGVFAPIVVDQEANSSSITETVTPTAYSLLYKQSSPIVSNSGFDTCANITATFSNLHGPSNHPKQIISADQGIQEAINDAANNGGGAASWVIDSGPVTLSTGAASTNLSATKIPTRSIVTGATARVTTTITGCTGGWSLGFTTGTEFGAANTTLTAGTTTDSSTLVPNFTFNAAAAVPIAFCTTANATAGAVHARVFGYKMVAPAQ
jgi:hypothetical protein